MCARPRSRCLVGCLVCFASALAIGCGGSVVYTQGDGGGAAGQGPGDGGAGIAPVPTPTPTATAQPAPTGSAPAPVGSTAPAPACGPSVVAYEPAGTPGCWACTRDACVAQASACAVDCVCNGAVSQSLSCVAAAGGTLTPDCFLPYMSLTQSDPAFGTFVACLLNAESQCCMGNGFGGVVLQDASVD